MTQSGTGARSRPSLMVMSQVSPVLMTKIGRAATLMGIRIPESLSATSAKNLGV
jgi:hypothetical protein